MKQLTENLNAKNYVEMMKSASDSILANRNVFLNRLLELN